jgi:hypothetical protein
MYLEIVRANQNLRKLGKCTGTEHTLNKFAYTWIHTLLVFFLNLNLNSVIRH